jgi:hypothetical protein
MARRICKETEASRQVSLYIGSSPRAAWEEVLLPWLEASSRCGITDQHPACVVVPQRTRAQHLRARLAAAGVSLLGVRFLVPGQLREFLQAAGAPRVPLREHLRLLLAISAEQCASDFEAAGKIDNVQVARAVARAPDELLRAIDSVAAAGGNFTDLASAALVEIAKRFYELLKRCGCVLVAEADRLVLQPAANLEPRFLNLLVTGFDAAHWPLWPLLRAAVLSARNTTVTLREPRDEAAELDRTWVSTWEEHFGPAQQITSPDAEPNHRFEALLALPETERATAARKKEPFRHIDFVMGHDSSEQAQAIVALALGFLDDSSCERLAILLPGPGALARLVSSWLRRLRVPHNDGIAHRMRGVFDDEEWRTWIELQEQPRVGSLLRFLNHSPGAVAFFAPFSLRKMQDTLQRACGDVLIDVVDVLREYCSRRTDKPEYAAVAEGLSVVRSLPERATFTQFVKETLSIFRALKWSERSAELERLSREWSESIGVAFSREHFLRWLSETFAESSLCRDVYGDHPYARVQLLPYEHAEGETWTHVIFAGLNEGVWPTRDDESPFLPDDEVAALNQRNKKQSRFGEGQEIVRESATLCLGSRERRALALRQLLNVIESTTQEIGVAAELYKQSPYEQAVNPSVFFARLFFSARGQTLSQREIAQIHERTREWLARLDFLTPRDPKTLDVAQTAEAYRARRTNALFGEYEFAFRKNLVPPKISLSATDAGNVLKQPALVWMKAFLGVQAGELNGGSWSLATGQWVHRWMAVIGAEPRENRFVARPGAAEIMRRVADAADSFRDEIISILKACKLQLPDWWVSGWGKARYLAEKFAKQLAATEDWPRLATEWELDSPHVIQIDSGDELRVRGRVDLILASAESSKELWIVDYKTGEAKPLRPSARELRKQLIGGEGVQVCIYALALQQHATNIRASLLTRNTNLDQIVTLDDIVAQNEIWKEMARMQNSGVFGMLGELRSEFKFTGVYPQATLEIDKDLLEQKWARTHPAFAEASDQ